MGVYVLVGNEWEGSVWGGGDDVVEVGGVLRVEGEGEEMREDVLMDMVKWVVWVVGVIRRVWSGVGVVVGGKR